jgi:tRNA(Arg) A34 adenosine deaminase TadA
MNPNPKVVEMLTRLAIDNPGIRNQFKLSAGITYGKSLIATGVNSYKTHPMMKQWGMTSNTICLHAEIDAIKNALKLVTPSELAKCNMYIVRVKRPDHSNDSWVHGLAKPCDGCQRAIASFNIKRVFYTKDQEDE